MRTFLSLVLATVFVSAAAITPALAEDPHARGERHEVWQGDIRHFHEHDYDHWRGGRWYHGHHLGQLGWWWIVDGFWYAYPTPIYPYPDPYTPPVVVTEPIPTAPIAAPPSYVFYCSAPAGYYPYVPRCYHAWRRVASTVIVEPQVQPPPVIVQPAPMVEGQREIDERQLNTYAVEFQNVDLYQRGARAHLKNIEQRVAAFRQNLYTRSYNAMDILRDADRLEHRIAEQREKLPQ